MEDDLRTSLNLFGEDAELLERLRVHLEKKDGKTSTVAVIRKALRLLAKKEELDGKP